jgi:hypothetical protein
MFRPVSNPLADEAPEDELPPPAAFSDEGSVDPETGEVEEIRQEPGRAPQIEGMVSAPQISGEDEKRTSDVPRANNNGEPYGRGKRERP